MAEFDYDSVPADEFCALIRDFAGGDMTRGEFRKRVMAIIQRYFPNATPDQVQEAHEGVALIALKYLATLD